MEAEHVKALVYDKIKDLFAGNKDLDPENLLGSNQNDKLQEVGEGNMNYVMRLEYGPPANRKSVIIKYAPPYVKIIGPEAPVSPARAAREYHCMVKYDAICPGSVPTPLYLSPEDGLIIMEDLSDYQVMKSAMKQQILDVKAGGTLAQTIAAVHAATHRSAVSSKEFSKLQDDYQNPEMKALTQEYVFERPYLAGDPTNRVEPEVAPIAAQVRSDQNLLKARDKFKSIFLEKEECLLHGDLHTNSVMFRDGDVKMIDAEFSFVGPAAWDVSYIIAHYVFSYLYHVSLAKGLDSHATFAGAIKRLSRATVDIYVTHMKSRLDRFMEDSFLSELAGFVGIELLRRTIGVAHPEDIRGLGHVEREAAILGKKMLETHSEIRDTSGLISASFQPV